MTEPAIKDPLPPEHKRFVLTQASIRLWIALAIVVALGVWFFTRI
jgi:hypothetical protein